MTITKQIFEGKQERITVCHSGRALLCMNEEEVTVTVQTPTSMDEDGNMEYTTEEKTEYAYDTCWVENIGAGTDADVLEAVKSSIVDTITNYDTSTAVNGFILNGATVWLDKATRVGLMNSTTIEKAAGKENTTLWLGNVKLEVPVDKAIELLSALEMYALECFNVTAAHKKAVQELEAIEEVVAYDYKAGYPDQLTMEV